ncbi:MAG: hypothetical protein KJO31_00655 [Gammaproteobacteria bacterium]|nr:hypothetical protein [Gammaproteobacteria bacterium]
MRKLVLIVLWVVSPIAAAELNPALRGNIDLGRVFMTPAERAILDQRRQQPENEVAPAREDREPQGQSVTDGSKRGTAPIGYIKSASGEPKKWQNGEFVPLADGESLPGLSLTRLRIISAVPAATADSADNVQSNENADDHDDNHDTANR